MFRHPNSIADQERANPGTSITSGEVGAAGPGLNGGWSGAYFTPPLLPGRWRAG